MDTIVTVLIALIATAPFIAGGYLWLRNRCKPDWSAEDILRREG